MPKTNPDTLPKVPSEHPIDDHEVIDPSGRAKPVDPRDKPKDTFDEPDDIGVDVL